MKKLFLIFISAILFSACSTSGDIAMKIDNVEIKKEFIEYFEKSYNTQSGGTVSEAVSQKARAQVELYGNVIAIGRKMGINAQLEYNNRIEAVKNNYGSVEEYLKQADISKELFDFLMYGTSYQTLILNEFVKDIGISEADIDQYFMSNYYRAKHLLLLTQGKSGFEKVELKKKIDEIFNQARNGADFDRLISEYNEDLGVKNAPDGYVFTYNEMVTEFYDAVVGIDIGQYAVVETDYGYHVVKRLALDETPELYKKFRNEKQIDICQSYVADKYFRENYWRVKQILLSTKNKSADEIAILEETAEEIYNRLLDGESFDELMEKYNQDENVADNPNGYVFTYNEMVPEYFDAVASTDLGHYNMVETVYGFHIIKRLAFDDPPEIYSELKNSKLEKIYQMEDVDINEMFLDYIHSKLEEYNIRNRNFTSAY